LADIYNEGVNDSIGIIPKDGQKAIYWYTKAAEQEDSESLVSLGHMYDVGTSVPQNYQQAIFWYTKAAELGNNSAQNRLGNLYYGDYADVQNYILAHMWYGIAAANGSYSSAGWREEIAKQMTSDQIQQAQKLATEWINNHPK
jgi:TPR repeat protein